MGTCKTCKYFERGKWHKAIDPNEGEQLGGYCAVLDQVIGMNNSFIFGHRIYIQESFGCIAHCETSKARCFCSAGTS
jgi:hypothetical protein